MQYFKDKKQEDNKMKHLLDQYDQEVGVVYKNNDYLVRNNGSVYRKCSHEKRKRKLDEVWTFGKPNIKTGYIEIASARVHRIVATAFHGEPPTPEHVVDHIDTNRHNNRPENLRWFTRLENALKNPITRKRIEFVCGSIEAFIKDPSILGLSSVDPNFRWMRTVTPEEAEACRERLELWAKSDEEPSGGSLGEWVFKPLKTSEYLKEPIQPVPLRDRSTPLVRAAEEAHRQHRLEMELVMAKTPGAAQRDWKTPSEFPCCPHKTEADPIKTYEENLRVGAIFARNDFSETVVLNVALLEEEHSLLVMCKQSQSGAIKPWSLAKISYEDGLYLHTSLGKFFQKQGAEKSFTIEQGLEWIGGDSIDEYC
jgi:hypothetical protein